MKDVLNKLKNEIILAIQYGEFEFLSFEKANDWTRCKVLIDETQFIIGVNSNTKSAIIYNLEMISNSFSKEENRIIQRELSGEIYSLSLKAS